MGCICRLDEGNKIFYTFLADEPFRKWSIKSSVLTNQQLSRDRVFIVKLRERSGSEEILRLLQTRWFITVFIRAGRRST